jgi:hypothetical protein
LTGAVLGCFCLQVPTVHQPEDKLLVYDGMDDSITYVERYMREHGPFDGLLGFSQGSTLSSHIALLQSSGQAFQVQQKLLDL